MFFNRNIEIHNTRLGGSHKSAAELSNTCAGVWWFPVKGSFLGDPCEQVQFPAIPLEGEKKFIKKIGWQILLPQSDSDVN